MCFILRFMDFHSTPPFSGSPVPESFSSVNLDMVRIKEETELYAAARHSMGYVDQVFVLEGRHPEIVWPAPPTVDPTVVALYEAEAGLAVLRVTVDYAAKEMRISNDYIVSCWN